MATCAAVTHIVAVRPKVAAKATRSVVVCSARNTGFKVGAAALAAAVLLTAVPAQAGLVEDLVAKSTANKELNDRKRAATSGANFERSRTVTDGLCSFPDNFIGCQNLAEAGKVKFLSDDIALECEGARDGMCIEKGIGALPSFMGV